MATNTQNQNQDQKQQQSQDKDKNKSNPGNFKNDAQRAAEAGEKSNRPATSPEGSSNSNEPKPAQSK